MACAAVETNAAIAKRMGLRRMTVGKWCQRHQDLGMEEHAKVKAWLAQRPRFNIHYVPAYASWLNKSGTSN